ncbi:MAG: phosphotransferase [Ilumatobacteraceae bacterium]
MITWSKTDSAGMGYECFSVDPLSPLNDQTRRRIDQLNSDLRFVEGKTVLDIGCHAGLASVMSLNFGARSVLATDISSDFLDQLGAWATTNRLPLSVENVAFSDLGPSHSSDVVLLLEVYHWLAKQGWSVEDVAAKLDSITRESILIESPWDETDPSVATPGDHNSKKYRLYELLARLQYLGFDIEFLGMTNYFPPQFNRVRIMCTRNREKGCPPQYRRSWIKAVAPVLTLPDKGFRLLSAISEESHTGAWDIRLPDESDYLESPRYFSRNLVSGRNLAEVLSVTGHTYLKAAWESVEATTLNLWSIARKIQKSDAPEFRAIWDVSRTLFEADELLHCAECDRRTRKILSDSRTSLNDSLMHGDLHAGNLLLVDDGFVTIDFENIHIGPAFADAFLFSLITRGAAADLPSALKRISKSIGRAPIEGDDLRHALAIASILYFRTDETIKSGLGSSIHETLSVRF